MLSNDVFYKFKYLVFVLKKMTGKIHKACRSKELFVTGWAHGYLLVHRHEWPELALMSGY